MKLKRRLNYERRNRKIKRTMIAIFIGILLGIVFICILPKLMEWTDWSSNDWKKKINKF